MSDDSLPIELDPLPMPELPAWVATLLVAIGAIMPLPANVAFAALSALCAPLQNGGSRRAEFLALPVNVQNAVRDAKSAKLNAINAAERTGAQQRATATQRQVIPVMQAPPVLTGTWTRIQSGPHAGEWGARVDNVTSVQTGQLVRLYKRGANRGSLHAVVAFGMRDNAAICAIRDATDAERNATRGTTPVDGVPVQVAIEPSGPAVEIAAESTQEPVSIEGALANAAAQGATLNAPQAPSSARAIAPVATVEPTSAGITTTTSGPSYFDRPRSERTGFQVGASQTSTNVRSLINERDFIAGAVAVGSMLQASWTGGGSTTAPSVYDALVRVGREDDAPEGKSTVAYAGDAVDSMRNREYDTYRRPNNGLPTGIKAEWVVGRKLTSRDAVAGEAYGTTLLVVSLKADDTLAFDGDLSIAASIRSKYASDLAKSTLKSDTLTAWLGRILRTRHGAVKRGHVWYIPGGQADAARALIDAISPLWGDHEHIPVTTGPDLMRSLTRGLTIEVQAIADDLAESTVQAKARARTNAEKTAREIHNATEASVTAAMDLAERRATVSNTVAARLLRDLGKVAARVAGYETVLGSDTVTNAKALIADLRRTLEPLTDDTSARAAMLELD